MLASPSELFVRATSVSGNVQVLQQVMQNSTLDDRLSIIVIIIIWYWWMVGAVVHTHDTSILGVLVKKWGLENWKKYSR